MPVLDTLGRSLRSLRISVTDRCNLRCQYCMPEDEYVWIPRQQLLTFEEILALVEVFVEFGVEKLRITGGEPLLRRDLPVLMLSSMPPEDATVRALGLGATDYIAPVRPPPESPETCWSRRRPGSGDSAGVRERRRRW